MRRLRPLHLVPFKPALSPPVLSPPGPATMPATPLSPLRRTSRPTPQHHSTAQDPNLRSTGAAPRARPGPGRYSPVESWVKNTHRYTGGTPVAAAARGAAARQRQPSAPSVPARGQAFGYEEDGRGVLVMQPPPEGGHTGACRAVLCRCSRGCHVLRFFTTMSATVDQHSSTRSCVAQYGCNRQSREHGSPHMQAQERIDQGRTTTRQTS